MDAERRWYELRDATVTADRSRMRILAVPYDVWTNVGWYHERVLMGAPDKSAREAARGLPLLMFHDYGSFPVGRSASWTLDDPAGLVGEWQLDSDDRSQEAARKVAEGFLTGASIGFQPIRSQRVFNDEDAWDPRLSRDEASMQVTRQEIRLLEVSLTPVPAYAGAQVQWVRSAEPRGDERGRPWEIAPATRRLLAEMHRMVEDGRKVTR